MEYLFLSLIAVMVHSDLKITSPSFKDGEMIPKKYTCDGANINPELGIENLPEGTKSLALIMDDPDAPDGTFDHWIMWNIPPKTTIAENSARGLQGQNGRKENKYTGPCPPSGTHHYHFKVYALDTELDLKTGTDKMTLEKVMKGHILSSAELIGLYKR